MGKFGLEKNGYNIIEVNNYLEMLTTKIDELIFQNRVQQLEINKLKKELKYYKEKNDTNSIEIEEELIIEKAKENASRIVYEALIEAENIENKTKILEKNIEIIKTKLKKYIDQQNDIISQIEIINLDPK